MFERRSGLPSIGAVALLFTVAVALGCGGGRPAMPTTPGVLNECDIHVGQRICGTWTYDAATDTLRAVWPTASGVIRIERHPGGAVTLHRTDDAGQYIPSAATYQGRRTETGYAGTTDGTYTLADGRTATYHSRWEAAGFIPEPPASAGGVTVVESDDSSATTTTASASPPPPCEGGLFDDCTATSEIAVAPSAGDPSDEADWQRAVQADTREAYQAYQDGHVVSGGAHLDEAEAMLVFFLSLERDDIPAWQEIVDGYPDHPRIAYARRRLAELSADADGDGVVNADDACPSEPETANGVDDTDGCPDTTDTSAIAAPSDVVWAPGGDTLPADTLVSTLDASDADLLWLVTQRGEVMRMRLSTQEVQRAGLLAAIAVSIHSLPGALVVRSIDGALWRSADGGAHWDAVAAAPAAARASIACGGAVWVGAPSGVARVEGTNAARTVANVDATTLFCDAGMPYAGVAGRGIVQLSTSGATNFDGHFGDAMAIVKRGDEMFVLGAGGGIVHVSATGDAGTAVPVTGGARALFAAGSEVYAVARNGTLSVWQAADRRWASGPPGLEGLFVRDVFAHEAGSPPYVLAIGHGTHLFARTQVVSRQTLVGSVLFASGSADPQPGLLRALDALAREWHAGRRLRVEGHTDAVGDPERNLELSRARAETVRRLLVERGVPDAAITTAGFGPFRPVAGNGSERDRARNRRVEVLFFDATPVAPATPPSSVSAFVGHWYGGSRESDESYDVELSLGPGGLSGTGTISSAYTTTCALSQQVGATVPAGGVAMHAHCQAPDIELDGETDCVFVILPNGHLVERTGQCVGGEHELGR